jgi:hypothetical protein
MVNRHTHDCVRSSDSPGSLAWYHSGRGRETPKPRSERAPAVKPLPKRARRVRRSAIPEGGALHAR